MKKLLVILPLLALLSCTGVPSQTVLSHFDWTEPADPQGEQPGLARRKGLGPGCRLYS